MEKKTAREMIREKYGTIVLSEPIHETLMQEFATQELTEYKTKLKKEISDIGEYGATVVNIKYVIELIDSL